MNKTNLFGYVMVGALSIGVLGAGFSAYASTNSTHSSSQMLDAATQQKVDTIMKDTKEKLAKIGVILPPKGEKHGMFDNLDQATIAKTQKIMDDMKKQLDELGVKEPVKGDRQH